MRPLNICILGGYVVGLSDFCGVSVDKKTENSIKEKMQSRPKAELGWQWMLNSTSLEWELAELPPAEPEPLTDEKALTRYANTLTGASDTDLISAAETLIEQRIKEDT